MKPKKIVVIACAVLGSDINRAAGRLGLDVDLRFLEAGLHERPNHLRQRLQAAIDAASADGAADRIVIGYGVCGRGTIGIQSRSIPLVIPRVHDCIALFLGGRDAYHKEFKAHPGTYYVSAGWHAQKAVPVSQRKLQAWYGDRRVDHAEIASRYGRAAADRTLAFLNTWQQNYRRAAFIDTGGGGGASARAYAREMADAFGWTFTTLQGSPALIEAMLTATATTADVLVVEPGQLVDFDAVTGALTSHPLWSTAAAGGPGEATFTQPSADDGRTATVGLGIDAGGTYTDAVIYDFSSGNTRGKAKALTTRWDFTIGIARALDRLDPRDLQRVDMVALSTTLATNAIVEGDGQKVGLLLMPPYGIYDPADYPHAPTAQVGGRLSITGEEIEPVDAGQVARTVRRMVDQDGVEAFAVSGFAGAINPAHELAVKRIIGEEADLFVTCGHELSSILDFKVRATTAVLNARIIPRLGKLIADLENTLCAKGIAAPIVVVKGDGTLMRAAMAKQRPVETILSGPAASVAGARHLTHLDDALVVDMGGTTTDTAAVEDGRVRICSTGSTVGGRRTHVRALDIRTAGLGGDSAINRQKGIFTIGPRRVAPMAWLGANHPGTAAAIDVLHDQMHRFEADTRNMQILVATAPADHGRLTDMERTILTLLDERPRSIHELARLTGVLTDRHLPLDRLEEGFMIQRCGLTPTDLLHLAGNFLRWDTAAAGRFFSLMAAVSRRDEADLRETLLETVARNLALEILKRQLDDEVNPDALHSCPVCQALMHNVFCGGDRHYQLRIDFKRPVVGIGAPIAYFLPRAAAIIGARAVLPEHADVANAIGAITSNVVIERRLRIVPGDGGGFLIEGIAGSRRFADIDAADAYAKQALTAMVRTQAREAGTSSRSVTIQTEDQLPEDATGRPVFIGRILQARLNGPPDRLAADASACMAQPTAPSPVRERQRGLGVMPSIH